MQRLSVVKVDASSVQGEGAYVYWKRMTWGERKAIMAEAQADKLDTTALILDHIAGWNWIDADGKPLPIPQSIEEMETLYEEEITFLASVATRALQGRLELTLEAEKN